MSWRHLEDFLKTFLQDILKFFLQDILKISSKRLEDVLKTSWKHLEDVLKTYGQDKYIGLDQDVLKTSSEDVRLRQTYSSWSRRLEDVFWRQRWKRSSRRLQDVFIKTNVSWEYCENHRTIEVVARSFSVKKDLLKSFSKFTAKLCARSSFMARLKLEYCSFIERRL